MIPFLLAAALQVGPPAPVPLEDLMLEVIRQQQETARKVDLLDARIKDLGFMAAGGAIDLYGTEFGLHRGGFREGNQGGFSSGARIAGKTLRIVALGAICHELRKDGHRGAVKWLCRVGAAGGWTAAGLTNIWRSR